MQAAPSKYTTTRSSCLEQNRKDEGVKLTDSNRNAKWKQKSKAEERRRRVHSESEKRRRMRINAQYATLRTILPNLVKRQKASVLAETIGRVTELKKTVSELMAMHESGGGTKESVLPGATDKLRMEYCEGEKGVVKASLSCEDRARLMSEVTRAVKSVKGRVERCEMATVGGRTKVVLWVKVEDGNQLGLGLGLRTLKRALRVLIEGPIWRGRKKLRLPQ